MNVLTSGVRGLTGDIQLGKAQGVNLDHEGDGYPGGAKLGRQERVQHHVGRGWVR